MENLDLEKRKKIRSYPFPQEVAKNPLVWFGNIISGYMIYELNKGREIEAIEYTILVFFLMIGFGMTVIPAYRTINYYMKTIRLYKKFGLDDQRMQRFMNNQKGGCKTLGVNLALETIRKFEGRNP